VPQRQAAPPRARIRRGVLRSRAPPTSRRSRAPSPTPCLCPHQQNGGREFQRSGHEMEPARYPHRRYSS
jgi:hypothetical protein